ncbi:uricase [Paenibacillus baekrokdamisoli]|uniref:2-oxo-4-hydroxy-4-carboxy-5-ureidoimidazoline decarboxylase n=1 Tax=Paenibacillus baekrokdamisoli TaxID=1712516 RepID=A0A3G9IV44_9BACL|nr:2-oxo-4-hydroxy-4-carboxy-5-ureidoimidazoline decarboxylase [Paenibacillus baekrokdamisoli]MBB3070604.1 2-oxo-4-hydroxy-4-carboxy-5-ureidoimidazoline decarboxylase [Paenibacillus baekrokdamisoli]BBH19955.1 uricase [Paenibacillus baekrokdamisoli]
MIITLWQLNTLSREIFVHLIGGIFEHSPWVADKAWEQRPFHSCQELHEAMMRTVHKAAPEQVLSLIRSHPDLVTRLEISEFSTLEQKGSGLDCLSPEQFKQFSNLNRAYVEKFGFPFVYAIRGKSKEDILEALKARMEHTPIEERQLALVEIGRITKFRIQDVVEE